MIGIERSPRSHQIRRTLTLHSEPPNPSLFGRRYRSKQNELEADSRAAPPPLLHIERSSQSAIEILPRDSLEGPVERGHEHELIRL
jgi:hypothetical protein